MEGGAQGRISFRAEIVFVPLFHPLVSDDAVFCAKADCGGVNPFDFERHAGDAQLK